MGRTIWIALAAGIALALGGAVWLNRALDIAFARGESAGKAATEAVYRAEFERRRDAAESALARSNEEALALERERAVLKEKLDDLVAVASRSAGAGTACLDADVVRALAATGGGDGNPSRP